MQKPQFCLLTLSLPVRIVKQKFLQDGEDSQLCQGPVEGGQLRATWVRSPGRQVVSRHYHGPRDAYPVEEDSLHCIAQLNGIHLDGGRFEQQRDEKMSKLDIISKIMQTVFLWQYLFYMTLIWGHAFKLDRNRSDLAAWIFF